jgi:hypothetical protein
MAKGTNYENPFYAVDGQSNWITYISQVFLIVPRSWRREITLTKFYFLFLSPSKQVSTII